MNQKQLEENEFYLKEEEINSLIWNMAFASHKLLKIDLKLTDYIDTELITLIEKLSVAYPAQDDIKNWFVYRNPLMPRKG